MFRKMLLSILLVGLLLASVLPLAAAPIPWPEDAVLDPAALTGTFSSEEPSDLVPLTPQARPVAAERASSPFTRLASFFASGEDEWPTVIIELPQAPLTVQYERNARLLSAADQKRYVTRLESVQAEVEAQFAALDVEVIDRYQLIYNGFLARVPAHRVELLQNLPGVEAVHDVPLYYPALEHSVPLIKADEVINDLGYDGTGVTVGIIDTGIDYMHEAFGGSGSVAEYQANDPTITTDYPITTSVIAGGWDFAGAAYNGSNTPVPDPDPIDYDGHGTHVASIVAGQAISGTLGAGVAPGAKLYALKVFGDGGGGTATALYISALEWAMDPNQDDDVTDHLDVVNMSLGTSLMAASQEVNTAVNNAVTAGMVVVASAGNAGDTHFIVDSPANADGAISVAASSTGYEAGPVVSFDDTSYVYVPGQLTGSPGFTETLTAELFNVATVQPQAPSLCSTTGFSGTELTDKVALVVFHLPNETGCTGSQQVNNAASLGAKAVIMYHYSPGVRGPLTGDPAPIPVGMVTVEAGTALMAAHDQAVTIHNQNEIRSVPGATPADTIGSFSSRGPRLPDAGLKPEVTAPGVQIVAAAAGSGDGGVAQNGTSMAAPHVAGVAALMRQAHPSWNPEMIKLAMMNTAVDLADGSWVSRYGAGRVDARAAIEAETFVGTETSLLTLSWGRVPFTDAQHYFTDTVAIYNEGQEKTFEIDWQLSTTQTLRTGIDVQVPVSVTVGGSGGSVDFEVGVTLDAQAIIAESQLQAQTLGRANILEEYHGFVTLTNTTVPTEVLRLPFYLIPYPETALSFETTSPTTVELTHTGAVTPVLETYIAYVNEPNDSSWPVAEADIHRVGMRHYEHNGMTYLAPLVSTSSGPHTWAELMRFAPYGISLRLYIDADGDGVQDYAIFPLSASQLSNLSADPNDFWMLIGVVINSGASLGPVGGIRADYFTNFMEWNIAAAALGIDPVNNPDFNFWFDYGMAPPNTFDITDVFHYDLSQPDITYACTSGKIGPGAPTDTITFDLLSNDPVGVYIANFNGASARDVLFIPLSDKIYLPLVVR